MDWWIDTVIYQIYLPSFKDSNGDGIGDFRGALSKLDYFDKLKVGTLLLSPFNPSPNKDNGYDITDYTAVDPQYGTMEDFDKFLTAAHAKGLHVILDLVANHTSDLHEWFSKSVNCEEPYKDYYIWADGKTNGFKVSPPNNWVSVFGGSAWQWNAKRKQYYLHQFLAEQPDLNLRNEAVKDEIKKILRFWLDKGVDGFRLDAISHFFEDEMLRDEPHSLDDCSREDDYGYLCHIYTKGQPENYEFVDEIRALFTEYQEKTGKYKLLLVESTESLCDVMRYYGKSGTLRSDVPFNFQLIGLNASSTAKDLFYTIKSWLDAMPDGKHANWILGNHDHPRFASRMGRDVVNILHMIIMMLPGIPFCYYGDEIGMENAHIPESMIRDSFALRTIPENSRDPSRTPMQWTATLSGFTTSLNPWLPVHTNIKEVNVESEENDPVSIFTIYKQLLELRRGPSVLKGRVEFPVIDGNIFSMARILQGSESFLVVVNMGECSCLVDFTDALVSLPEDATLKLSNNPLYAKHVDSQSESLVPLYMLPVCKKNPAISYDKIRLRALATFKRCNTAVKLGDGQWKVSLNNVFLFPKEGMVLSFVPLG